MMPPRLTFWTLLGGSFFLVGFRLAHFFHVQEALIAVVANHYNPDALVWHLMDTSMDHGGDNDDSLQYQVDDDVARTKSYFARSNQRQPMRMKMKIKGPVFVLNLPKSGTKSIHKFFECGLGNYWSGHHWMRNASGYNCRLGECMGRNHRAGRPLVEGCGGFHIYNDAGAIWEEQVDLIGNETLDERYQKKHCFFPGLHGLDNIAKFYPDATLIHLRRNSTEWVSSVRGWVNILTQWSVFCPGFPRITGLDGRVQVKRLSDSHWRAFYDGYTKSTRAFASEHPSITYIEADLESPHTPDILEQATGIPGTCFGHTHKTKDVKWLTDRSKKLSGSIKATDESANKSPIIIQQLKLPTPIFVLNLPRTESISIHEYFKCGFQGLPGHNSSHQWFNNEKGDFVRVAECMSQNNAANLPLAQGCGNFTVYSEPGGLWQDKTTQQQHCFFPGLEALENIATHYPTATLLHVKRHTQLWVRSCRNSENTLNRMASFCNGVPRELADESARDEDWAAFYEQYSESIRQFVRRYPSLTFVEASLESSDTPALLDDASGIPASCFGQLPHSSIGHNVATTKRHISKINLDAMAERKAAIAAAKSHQNGGTPKLKSSIRSPVFVLNLPKTGTESIHKFFECSGIKSSHQWMKNESAGCHQCRIGECMARNNVAGRPLVQGCGDYTVYTDSGLIWYDEISVETQCFYPGVHGLENIARFYPDATLIHIKRNALQWAQSARKWLNILGRMSAFCEGFPRQASATDTNVTDNMWADFYENYSESLRRFAREHKSITFIEADLESPNTAAILAEATGLTEECFGHHHKTSNVNFGPNPVMIQRKTPLREMKIPSPVFVLSLPKSATNLIHLYFECGLGVGWSGHQFMRNATGHHGRLGECMARNVASDRPLVEGCGGYTSFVNAGAIWKVEKSNNPMCFSPGVHGLDNIAKYYPESTIMLLTRNTSSWVAGARNWNNLLGKISAYCDGFPRQVNPTDTNATDAIWAKFYEVYTDSIRAFAREHKSLTYIEADVESAGTPSLLEKATGLPATCYRNGVEPG